MENTNATKIISIGLCTSRYGMLYALYLIKGRISCILSQYLAAQFALQSILKKKLQKNDIDQFQRGGVSIILPKFKM